MRWWLPVLVLVVAATAHVAVAGTAEMRQADPARTYRVPVDGAPARGAREAKVTIVEFGDYHCPWCQEEEKVFAALLARYPRDLRVVFRPVLAHRTSLLPTVAALAAGEQGRYWELHDALFADLRKTRQREAVDEIARGIGLDMAKYDAAMDDGHLIKRAEEEDALGLRFGVQGTPTLFVNGRFFGGYLRADQLAAIVDEELAHADALLAKGTRRAALYDAMTRGGDAEAPLRAGALDESRRYAVPVGTSPIYGNATAKVTIVEFGEFECSFCLKLHPRLQALVRAYGKDVRLVFKHAPMVHLHPHSRLAALASIAAGEQGKFWQMHDLLFGHPKKLERAELDRYAAELGLDRARFARAVDGGAGDAQVLADLRLAQELHVNGTPTTFVNGRPIIGVSDDETFRKLIDEEIKAADALLAKGVKPAELYEKLLPAPSSDRRR